jgi:hypothetical protein
VKQTIAHEYLARGSIEELYGSKSILSDLIEAIMEENEITKEQKEIYMVPLF